MSVRSSKQEQVEERLADTVAISDKAEGDVVDPRLRPFIVAMANAILKDMLREQHGRQP